ncbi:MAG: sulfatase-like hydrolase/transferase [Acidobacteria bacterium]|nr:sulfatase-like hydrolase/transferase [Acidobacteriota bacterium]
MPLFRSLAFAWIAIAAQALAAPPNLVVFLSDDHSMLDSTPYGSTAVRTPNMQRVADDGLRFTHAFVAAPACAPSRASLLTGLYPARHLAEDNHAQPRDDVRKLPAYLHDLGYQVVAFGKVSHYRQTGLYGFDHFDYDSFHDHRGIQAALDYLDAWKQDKPLCLFVGTNWPHTPWPEKSTYDPAEVSLEAKFVDTPETRDAVAQYYQAINNMDDDLGRIYDGARRKFGDDLIFLQTSDHGAQLPFSKWNLYDGGIRVPMLAVWPGVIRPGSSTSAMVQWIDILPTLVELAGGRAPDENIDGRSFAPVLRGERDEHRDRIFTTHSGDRQFNVYPIRSIRTRDWKYIRNLHPEFQYASHINRHAPAPSLIYWRSWEKAAQTDPAARTIVHNYRERPREELYDLRNDPHELHNLAGEPAHRQRLDEMALELDRWMQRNQDSQRVFSQPLLLGDEPTLLPPKP